MFLKCVTNSTVLLKVDYNISEGMNSFDRIDATIDTVKLLLSNNNKVVILTHWGRPKGERDDKHSTLKLKPYIDKVFASHGIEDKCQYINQYESFVGAKLELDKSDQKLFILENTRFHSYEKSSSSLKRGSLARNYAILGDYFVDEAFSLSHRQEVTNSDLRKIFGLSNQAYYGLLYEIEMQNLHIIKEQAESPFVVIMGGAKLETKLPLIENMVDKVDKIVVAGLLAFTFLKAKEELGQDVPEIFDSAQFIESDYVGVAKELLEAHGEKFVLPVDYVYGNDEKGGKFGYDIGEKSLELFKESVSNSATVFWNGPLGFYEKKPYDKSTRELAHYLTQIDAFTALGGGDVVSAVTVEDKAKISFVSMGGGASLDYLSR